MDKIKKKQMGARIKKLRENYKYSQDELAEKLGMGRANIANYEAGRAIPPSDILSDVADILGVSTDYILGRGVNEYSDESFFVMGDIGQAIKEERIEQGLKQQDIASASGVNQRDISNYERGINLPTTEVMDDILKTFGLSLHEFIEKYDLNDEYIPPQFNGDSGKAAAHDTAVAWDAQRDDLGYDSNQFNKKDKRDIVFRLEQIHLDLANQQTLMLSGDVMDDETRELLKSALEHAIKMSKLKAKNKFNPTKNK